MIVGIGAFSWFWFSNRNSPSPDPLEHLRGKPIAVAYQDFGTPQYEIQLSTEDLDTMLRHPLKDRFDPTSGEKLYETQWQAPPFVTLVGSIQKRETDQKIIVDAIHYNEESVEF
jgi:hypothetical protein